jgi:predicted homoserine dehydrogenase-like protein
MQECRMNLQQIFDRFAPTSGAAVAGAPLPVGLVGAGEFGATFVAQASRMQGLQVIAVCDRDTARAQAAALAAGHPAERVRVCADVAAARAAVQAGAIAIVDSAQTLVDLPLVAVLEATGDPEGAAATALAAIDAGRHVVIATKEAEIVVGPELARRAAERGVVHSPVDGDQPSLLIGLVGWARMLGLPVVCAGKASESDFVWDPIADTVTAWGRTVPAAGYGQRFAPGDDAMAGGAALDALLAARGELPFAPTTVPDLCEMGIVANHTGLLPDRPGLHAPIARTVELPTLFRQRARGGLLSGTGRIDMFNCLRRPDELSFAGGVFVVVEAPDEATGRLFAAKGMPACPQGRHVLLHNPVHLLGAEAAMSMLSAVQLGCSTGGADVRPIVDLVASAARDLEAGELLTMGARHVIDGLGYRLEPARPMAADAPLPYYLAVGARVRHPVRRGEPLRCRDVDLPGGSTLLRLRQAQDARFFG